MQQTKNIILIGNPNSGKTSVFNTLTGLNQKVGNFPGVTVDKMVGELKLENYGSVNIIDLPGMYSIYPKKEDEWVSYEVIMQQHKETLPNLIVVAVDASNLKRNLLLCTQIIDLKMPVIIALTMMDLASKKDIQIDIAELERQLSVPIVIVNPRKNKGFTELKKRITNCLKQPFNPPNNFINFNELENIPTKQIQEILPQTSEFETIHYLINNNNFNVENSIKNKIIEIEKLSGFNATKTQAEEILMRFQKIKTILKHAVVEKDPLQKTLYTQKLDRFFLHPKWGYLILIFVLLVVFQLVFWLADYPMQGIEYLFNKFNHWLVTILPDNLFSNILTNGLIPGLSGIFVFVPQIMILFGVITLLEDSGYMARISFLTDRLMRKVGLSGKSVMPLISGLACAVPAIMSTRSIENKKERLLSIMVTPLMSCSARLPVYTTLIALIIPRSYFLGFLSLRGLALMFLYFFGTFMTLIVAWVFKKFIHIKEKSFFILELPDYRSPRWKNAFQTMFNKAKIFVVDAGKVIIVISIILSLLSSFGPSNVLQNINIKYDNQVALNPNNSKEINKERKAKLLEQSYAGIMGKSIEPIIKPLGYDWKIGIALITSFAAREVFVGTMATLYESDDDDTITLENKMAEAKWEDGKKVYTWAAGISLLLFYSLAMQCMSTLAIVYKETKSIKWPIIQFIYMTLLAYLIAFVSYQIFK